MVEMIRLGTSRRLPVAASLFIVAGLVLAPSTLAGGTTFVSKRYGYSLRLPGGSSRWLSSLATENWSSGGIEHGSPGFDTFTDLRKGRIYFLAARAGRSSLGRWTAFVVSARPAVCGAPRSLPRSTLAGEQARVLMWSCSDGYRVIVTTALHAHRGYVMLVASQTTLSRASDLRAARAARRSFRFRNR